MTRDPSITGNVWTPRSAAGVTAASLAAAMAALAYYVTDARRPLAAAANSGWWVFSDQQRYLRSALAFAHGQFDPASHYYMPGYALLAAPFVRLGHANPFLVPDLACQVGTLILAACLAGSLAPQWRGARAGGAAVALAAMVTPAALEVWVTPWTSTPEATLTLGALLAMLHLSQRPAHWRAAGWAGFCAASVAAFRPLDAAVLSVILAAATLAALLRAWPGRAWAGRTVAAAVGGGTVGAGLTIAGYVAVNGWQMSDYLKLSAAIGFEWRLLPLRWVTVVLSPQPLLPSGTGLISRFPWIPIGLAGMAACLIKPPAGGSRLAHLLVAGAACLHIALYLCYRDLHPQGLWLYYNYHYMKWPLVLLALYAMLLLPLALERRWRAMAGGFALAAALLPWRAELVAQRELSTLHDGPMLRLPALELTVGSAVMIPALGSFDAIYNTTHNLYVGRREETWYSSTADFKTMPVPDGLLIVPLRPMRAGVVTIHFGPGIVLADAPSVAKRQRIVFGVPCWLPWSCR